MMEPSPRRGRADQGPPHAAGLTRRQREAFDFIYGFYLEYGAAPTCAEIAAHLGVKTRQSAHRLVRRLEARGAVTRCRGQARSLAPVLRNAVMLELPPALDHAVRVLAQRARTTPEAVIIEAVHERLAGFCRTLAPRGRPPKSISEEDRVGGTPDWWAVVF
jgi:hypothetical protein